jgi:DNA-binding NarL/FixJ family response regulator
MKSTEPNAGPIGIVIIEDNRFLRKAWKSLLANVPEFVIKGDFGSCEDAFASKAFAESHVALMDIGLPGLSGIEGVAVLRRTFPHIATVICTVYEEEQKIFDALCAGAVGYLLKDVSSQDLIRAIREAAGGGSPMTPNIARKVIAYFQEPTSKGKEARYELTDREIQTLSYLAEGKTYVEIAESSFIGIDAVRSRIRNIYVKLQVNSRGEAVAKGLSQRIIRHF